MLQQMTASGHLVGIRWVGSQSDEHACHDFAALFVDAVTLGAGSRRGTAVNAAHDSGRGAEGWRLWYQDHNSLIGRGARLVNVIRQLRRYGIQSLMIRLTRLNRAPMVLNSDLIEHIDVTPDTVITLTTGQILRVRESADEVVERIVEFRRHVLHPNAPPVNDYETVPD